MQSNMARYDKSWRLDAKQPIRLGFRVMPEFPAYFFLASEDCEETDRATYRSFAARSCEGCVC